MTNTKCFRCNKSDKVRYFEDGQQCICDRCNLGQLVSELI